jgi:hypothetical protein
MFGSGPTPLDGVVVFILYLCSVTVIDIISIRKWGSLEERTRLSEPRQIIKWCLSCAILALFVATFIHRILSPQGIF